MRSRRCAVRSASRPGRMVGEFIPMTTAVPAQPGTHQPNTDHPETRQQGTAQPGTAQPSIFLPSAPGPGPYQPNVRYVLLLGLMCALPAVTSDIYPVSY